ncbi:rna methyltransferase [Trichoderma cornu-damae]|uniref:rRNA methyltransferase 1, mitochondrial n=1 Tax=Trichoderma cornu-damae TaxID=654480 RepID=A0A9P8QNP1_9HYPO|nr:rna methyltransferase [Trichoderma cornu-damae]
MISLGQLRANGPFRKLFNCAQKASAYSLQISRPASLSAIHRGVRRSERIQFGDVSRDRDSSSRGGSGRLTRRALEGAASPRQQQKLRKKLGRRAAEELGEESGKQTRRKRFLNPEFEYGKKSLVYQLKHGALKDQAASLIQEPVRPLPFQRVDTIIRRRTESPRFATERLERPLHSAGRPIGHRGNRHEEVESPLPRERRNQMASMNIKYTTAASHIQEPVRPLSFQRQRVDTIIRRRTESPRFATERSERPLHSAGRPIGHRGNGHEEVESPLPRERRNQMMSMNIKYTTAASQFLYGKSVVKAALEQARRKLYKLFIYGGENRRDSKDNVIITRLAERRGVPITIIPNEDQRLMDKMSMGRPHNGFVLETSPLPRLPVRALGRLEETPGKLGFHVELDYQSKEEEDINGRDTFIPRKNDNAPKPFVLLLNEILDPGNLGGILRTASYLGVDAVGITNRSSSTLTPVVLKSAAGAVEEITIFSVDSPVSFIEDSKKAGWKTYAAVAPPDSKLVQRHEDKFISTATVETEQPLTSHPCVLVLGNEGYGLSKPIKVAADYELSVPYFVHGSCVDSLNVSVAAGLLCHAFVRTPSKGKSTVTKIQKEAVSETKPGAEKDENQGEKEVLF